MTYLPVAIRKILVPVDFTELSREAFLTALQLARKCGAQLKLLHVIEVPLAGAGYGDFYSGIEMTPVLPYQGYDLILPDLLDQARLEIAKLVQVARDNGVTAEQEVVADAAIARICQMVKDESTDLVVIGSVGADGLEEFLVGSDAEDLVRQCECPVLTIKQKQDSFEVRYILFPADFTAETDAVVPFLRFYQRVFGAHLNLLYVQTKNDQATAPEIRERMQAFADRHELSSVNLLVHLNTSASGGILATASEMKHDLILMPTHGRSGFSQLFHKSIAESVVNHAQIPVLTFHWPA